MIFRILELVSERLESVIQLRSRAVLLTGNSTRRESTLLHAYIGTLVFIAGLLVFLTGLQSYKYVHRDEANWTRVSVFAFRTYFIDRDFDHPDWQSNLNRFGSYNPQIGKYILGASQWAMGYQEYDGIINWQEGNGMQWHIEHGYIPSEGRLYAARLPVAILASLTVAVMYWFVVMLTRGNILAGLVGSLLFTVNPLVLSFARKAMLDLPGTALGALTVFLCILSVRQPVRSRSFLFLGLLSALSAGLAIGTKLTSGAAWVSVFLIYLIVLAINLRKGEGLPHLFSRENWQAHLPTIQILFALIVIPPLIFYVSNPFLFNDPIESLKHMLSLNAIFAKQRAIFPEEALYTVGDRLRALFTLSHGYSAFQAIHWLLSGLGLVYVIRLALAGRSTAYALLIWAFATTSAFATVIYLARPRWYLPMLPIVTLLEVMGMLLILQSIGVWLHTSVGQGSGQMRESQ